MGRSRILILVVFIAWFTAKVNPEHCQQVSDKHERLGSPEEFIALALLAALDSVAMQAKP